MLKKQKKQKNITIINLLFFIINKLNYNIMDKFWTNDPSILINKFYEFIPDTKMTLEAKLNAMTRFFIYFGFIMSYYYKKKQYLFVSIIGSLLTILMYNAEPIETFEDIFESTPKFYNVENQIKESPNVRLDNRVFNNNANIIKKIPITDENMTCRRPTKNNPFMNTLVTEMNTPAKEPCNLSNFEIKETANNYFKGDMYRDTDDIFQKNNNDRQFYSLPSKMNYQDQEILGNWLYNTEPTCKQDSEYCFRYEDIRHQYR